MRIKELRLEKNLTQSDVAKAINTSQRNIGRWENNENEPSAYFVSQLANFFEVSSDYLLGLEDDYGTQIVPAEHIKPYVDLSISSEERNLIENYRTLNPSGKKLINETIKTLQATNAQSTDKREAN